MCQQSTGIPISGAQNTRWVGKFAILDSNQCLSWKRWEMGPSLLWNVLGSCRWRIDPCQFSWPWVTPNLGFRVMVYLQVEYIEKVHLRNKNRTLIGNHTLSIEWYHFQWLWITSNFSLCHLFYEIFSIHLFVVGTSAVNSTKKSSDLHTDTGMSGHSNWCVLSVKWCLHSS